MRTEFATESLNWSILSISTLSTCQKFLYTSNYICHRTDRLTERGGEAIRFRRDIVNHSVPVPGLTHLRASANKIMMDGKLVKIVAPYLLSSRPLIDADLIVCSGGGFSALLAGDLIVKHVNWNSRPSTRRGKLLCHYAGEHSCLILCRAPQPPIRTTCLLLPKSSKL
jgi:hypothetical protein